MAKMIIERTIIQWKDKIWRKEEGDAQKKKAIYGENKVIRNEKKMVREKKKMMHGKKKVIHEKK